MGNVGSIQTAKGEMFTNAHVLSQSRASLGYFVISGCDVNQSGTPGMSVVVDSGYIQYGWGTAIKTVAGGTVVITAAHSTLPRMDVLYIDSNGTVRVYDGTPTAISPGDKTDFKQFSTPAPGTNIPSGVIIALVYVAAADTAITNAEILDIATYGAYLVESPTTTTSGKVPYWSSTAHTLLDGYSVGSSANYLVQLDSSARLPAVSGTLLTGVVHPPASTTSGKVPVWSSTSYTLDDGVTLGTAALTASTDYAVAAKGVTNGDSHDHVGGDGAQIDHGGLAGRSDDDHTQYHTDARGDARYAPIAKGVTNGDSHNHVGGDGGQIDHGTLSGLTDDDHTQYIKHSLATATSDFLVASGSGAFIKKTLAETKTVLGLGSAAYTASTDYAVAAKGVTNGDSHNHVGGDGAQIAYSSLSGLPLRGADFAFGDGSTVLTAQACTARIPSASTIKKAYIRSLDTAGALKSGSITCTIYIHDYNAVIGSAVDSFALSSTSSFGQTGLSIAVAAGKYITCVISGITTVTQIVLSLEMEAA